MPDPADIGNDTAQFCTAEAERRQRALAQRESQPNFRDFDGLDCVDCMEEIPSNRLATGAIRCIECQQKLELQQRMRRH